ncbi:MAG TPA: metallopeptidase family protein [Phycisphaerae bacterium]|nr:metallopeptidase family protein [Phycisphaerae bacterium]
MSEEAFAEIVEDALGSIPDGFRGYLKDIAVDIEDMPDETTCEDVGIRDPRELLGLYHGTPLIDRHVDQLYRYPERIVIYQRNIERMSRTREQMIEQIRKTVLHEVGHHFGLNEKHLRDLGYG